jgi:hypothetical protein
MGHGKILDRPPSYKNRRESEASRTHLEARQGTIELRHPEWTTVY